MALLGLSIFVIASILGTYALLNNIALPEYQYLKKEDSDELLTPGKDRVTDGKDLEINNVKEINV
jgi:hypothetical protein